MKKSRIISALMALAIVVTPVIEFKPICQTASAAQQMIEAQAKVVGWNQKNGKWYYNDKNGNPVKEKWMLIDNRWFYFNANGTMHTGWLTYKGKKYYLFPSSGVMVTGCAYVGKDWYNFNLNGELIEDTKAGVPYHIIYNKPIYTNTTSNIPTGNYVRQDDLVFVTSFDFKRTAVGITLWGKVNYEGNKKGWIILTNNRNIEFAENNFNICKHIVDTKFKYNHR